MNEEDTLKFLSAFYRDYKSLGINGPRSHIVLAPTTPSTTKLSLHLPVFLQERGSEAHKFSEILVTITPQGTATEEITSILTSQLRGPISDYTIYIDRKKQRPILLHPQNLDWCDVITADSLQLVATRPCHDR